MELKFKSLPFTPEQGQVIYIESEYNEKLNKFIRNHYESLKSDFAKKGLMFCYLPLLTEETIRYNAPYVGREGLKQLASQVPSLSKFAIGADSIEPSLVFAIDLPVTGTWSHLYNRGDSTERVTIFKNKENAILYYKSEGNN